jgi:hypothetical protein
VRRLLAYDPTCDGPDTAGYKSHRGATANRWAVICQACYSTLDKLLGVAETTGQMFTMAGVSRGERPGRSTRRNTGRSCGVRPRSWGSIWTGISDEVGVHSLSSCTCEFAPRVQEGGLLDGQPRE